MGKTYANEQKDDENEDDLFYSSSKNNNFTDRHDRHAMYTSLCQPRNLVKGVKPGKALILKLIHPEARDNWLQEAFIKLSHGGGIKIPKHLISIDEKYLRRCLELIHTSSSKGPPSSTLSLNLKSLHTGLMSDDDTKLIRMYGSKHAIDYYPMDIGSRDLVINPMDEEIVGSVMGSNSMMRILRSPLFQRLGISDREIRLKGTSLFENKRCHPTDYQSSPRRLSTSSLSHNSGKTSLSFKGQGYGSDPLRGSPLSISSGGQQCVPMTTQSPPSLSQGMLQCTWKDGIPHFAFSLNDQKELYVATAWKVEETNNDKALEYVYSFHIKPSGQNSPDMYNNSCDNIGKMKVSTSFSLCSDNSKIMETEFVLFVANENHTREVHAVSRNAGRGRKLSKVMEVFKSGHSFKHRTPSLFGGANANPEDFSSENIIETCTKLDQQMRPDLSESDFLPNDEMLAIVVKKDHFQDEACRNEEVGGWGLKFLKKSVVKKHVTSLDACTSSESFLRNNDNCSTSMDIIVPSGPHGGPRTKNGGPISLVERWRSGGRCDCGGWDIGCPLKVLKPSHRSEERWHSSQTSEECKSFDLLTEGSKQGTPTVKMVNIHDNSYFISFQNSFLSALQCFSIAVAIVHSQHPTLRSKHVQN